MQRSHLIFVGKQDELDLLLKSHPKLEPLIRYQIILQSDNTYSAAYGDLGHKFWKVNSRDKVFDLIKQEL